MKKGIVIDVKATFGDLFYIGAEEVYKYDDNNKRTDQVIGYNYNLASSVQGDSIKIKVLGAKKEFEIMQPVKLVGLETNVWARTSGNFANVQYSFIAEDIVGA